MCSSWLTTRAVLLMRFCGNTTMLEKNFKGWICTERHDGECDGREQDGKN